MRRRTRSPRMLRRCIEARWPCVTRVSVASGAIARPIHLPASIRVDAVHLDDPARKMSHRANTRIAIVQILRASYGDPRAMVAQHRIYPSGTMHMSQAYLTDRACSVDNTPSLRSSPTHAHGSAKALPLSRTPSTLNMDGPLSGRHLNSNRYSLCVTV
ncbi:hypothetical protein OBBRIDRAFT_136491 [Obba rivulosa]|uniref:Uncharacterized protein n=1 Tax=Obba rivulosa TaxID=1052685 RepID=A0A8E2ATL0_9APHY|nr:hypothetical protein OBBRIDRAFT_136491 [Obba rivulosa]